jgi:ABC-type cobalamin/Fe3+-siderophores transport system ATPase subunit
MDANPIHFARVDFRNDDRVFGIKNEDRFLHVYIIGKTGTGKSTLIETMALQDLERGNGFALIDPHGDLVARVAARVPASQRDRVIYLKRDRSNPALRVQSPTSCQHRPHCARRFRHDGCLQKDVARRMGRAHGTHFAQRTHGPPGTAGRDTPRRATNAF